MIKVSIILTVCNGASYLRECLDSIVAQSMDEIEIICVDDASKDSTAAILEEYRENDCRIRIVENAVNCGAGASRNKGLELAGGKYVIFLDADDIFEKDMLQQAYQRAENYGADICAFSEDWFREDIEQCEEFPYRRCLFEELEQKGVFSPSDVKEILFNIWNGWAWDKLFRKEFILKTGLRFQEIISSNDAFFVHAALASAEKVTCLNKIFVHYRMSQFSLSNRRNHSWECCYLYLQKLKAYLEEHHKYEEFEKSFVNWSSNFLYWNYWSLNEEMRGKLFLALKEYMLESLGLYRYGQEVYYNPFYYWFIQRIHDSNTCFDSGIPVEATQRWIEMLRQNENRIEKVFQYLEECGYCAAVWGAGERGRVFLSKYGNRNEIKKIYDMDSGKVGQKVQNGYMVEMYNEATCGEIDFIFVTNTSYFNSIAKIAKNIKPTVKIFDLERYQEPYLSLPISLEECIL